MSPGDRPRTVRAHESAVSATPNCSLKRCNGAMPGGANSRWLCLRPPTPSAAPLLRYVTATLH